MVLVLKSLDKYIYKCIIYIVLLIIFFTLKPFFMANENNNIQNQDVVNENKDQINSVEELDCDMWGQNSDDPNYMSQPYWALLEEQYAR